MTTKSIFQIAISRPSHFVSTDHAFYAGFTIVPDMADTDTQSYEPLTAAAVRALNACGIHNYSDVYCAPQAALVNDEFEPGRCIENIRGLTSKQLENLLENLMRLGWELDQEELTTRLQMSALADASDRVEAPRKIAACAAEVDEVSEPVDEETRFYVIGTELVGPNAAQERGRFDCYEITTEPAMTNQSHEVITEGWAGTTNDISITAHGVFDTYDEARATILSILGDDHREEEVREAGNVVARFTIGAYPAMGAEHSVEWAGDVIEEVEADETDEDIDARVTMLEKQAIDETETKLDADRVRKVMQERRDALKEEAEDADRDMLTILDDADTDEEIWLMEGSRSTVDGVEVLCLSSGSGRAQFQISTDKGELEIVNIDSDPDETEKLSPSDFVERVRADKEHFLG